MSFDDHRPPERALVDGELAAGARRDALAAEVGGVGEGGGLRGDVRGGGCGEQGRKGKRREAMHGV